MSPLANDFGPVAMPPTEPRYVDGGPGSEVPSVTGMKLDAARKRLQDSGSRSPTNPQRSTAASKGSVVGTTPNGKTIPGSVITINTSTGVPPPPVYLPTPEEPAAPPPPPPLVPPPPPPPDPNVILIPGLPPIFLRLRRHRRHRHPARRHLCLPARHPRRLRLLSRHRGSATPTSA